MTRRTRLIVTLASGVVCLTAPAFAQSDPQTAPAATAASAAAAPSTAFTGAEKALDWKLLACTAMYVEAAIALALIALWANPVDILGALTSGLVVAFILHLLIGGARRR